MKAESRRVEVILEHELYSRFIQAMKSIGYPTKSGCLHSLIIQFVTDWEKENQK